MVETTLRNWGNSQGVVIPKSICEEARAAIGDRFIMEYDGSAIILRPDRRAYRRTKVTTIEELFAGWDGPYEPPEDYPFNGNEIDWGAPVGSEVLK